MSDASSPTAKRRMGILKKLGIGAGVALGCLVLAVLVLAQLAARWEARVQPLRLSEVQRKTGKAVGPVTDTRQRTTVDTDQAGESASPEETLLASPKPTRLTSCPTTVQLNWFSHTYHGLAQMKEETKLFVAKIMAYAVSGTSLDPTRDRQLSMPGLIGWQYFEIGDFEEAREWLPEAIRVEKNECSRRYLCTREAWLAQDPEVAVALLEESLSGPVSETAPEFLANVARANALDLCVVTGSDNLAEYYYRRYRDSFSKMSEEPAVLACFVHPETVTWLHRREEE